MPISYYPGFLPGPLAWSRWFKPICTLRTAKRPGFDARGTDVCPVGGLTGFRQALPPPIHRMIWIERPQRTLRAVGGRGERSGRAAQRPRKMCNVNRPPGLRKRRDRHDDVDTSLVPSLLRKQINVEITTGKVL